MVKAEQFVKAWQAGKTLDEVAKKLDLTRDGCSTRASAYRKKGIPLKAFRNREVLDVAELKKLCKNGD